MPTQKDSLAFVRKHRAELRKAGLPAVSNMNSRLLNDTLDKVVEKAGKSISNEWKRMKLVKDMSPEEKEKTNKALKRAALKKGKPMGKGVDLSKRQTMKKDSIKASQKAGGSY